MALALYEEIKINCTQRGEVYVIDPITLHDNLYDIRGARYKNPHHINIGIRTLITLRPDMLLPRGLCPV